MATDFETQEGPRPQLRGVQNPTGVALSHPLRRVLLFTLMSARKERYFARAVVTKYLELLGGSDNTNIFSPSSGELQDQGIGSVGSLREL